MFLLYLYIEQYRFFSLTFSFLWCLGLGLGFNSISWRQKVLMKYKSWDVRCSSFWCMGCGAVNSQFVVTIANLECFWCHFNCKIPVTAAVMWWRDCSRIGSVPNWHLAVILSLLYIIVVHSLPQICVHLLWSVLTAARHSLCNIQHTTFVPQKYAHKQMMLPFWFHRYV